MANGELGRSLIDVLNEEGGKDLAIEASEFALDSLLQEGFIKDLPVIGSVAKLYSSAKAAQGYLFAQKIKRFFARVSDIPLEDRLRFTNELNNDESYKKRLSDLLPVLIDQLNDLEKAPLLANAFSGLVRQDYDLPTFQRLSHAIDKCLIDDFSYLDGLDTPRPLEGYVGDVLVSSGLAHIHTIPTIREFQNSRNTYVISSLGELFMQCVYKGEARND